MPYGLYMSAEGAHAQATRLEVIANNLANIETTAFKRSRPNFEDLFYRHEVLPGAEDSTGNYTATGTSIGLGSKVSSVQAELRQGAFKATNRRLDVAIEGQGFFTVLDPATSEMQYTRAGNFSVNRETRLADLNHGSGVAGTGTALAGTAAFRISRRDGVEIEIYLAGCQTIGDCLDAINSHALNANGMLRASLSAYGNGIELVDRSAGDAVLEVSRIGTSTAAIDLGLILDGADSASAQTHDNAASSLVGTDCNPAETKSLFTALLRLQRALQDNDLSQIQRSIELLDASVLQMNFSRAELGVRQQGLDVLGQRLDAEELDLREVLSSKYDADLAEVISNLTARQIALQASMKATAQTFQMTLLDYL